LKDIDFIAYELIIDKHQQLTFEEQFKNLCEYNFHVVPWIVVQREDVTFEKMMDLFSQFKKNSEYQLDGIVVSVNERYKRELIVIPIIQLLSNQKNENMKHLEATVKEVIWKPTALLVYFPVITIDPPVSIQNKNISTITAHNAKFVLNNKINTGAKIIVGLNINPIIVKIVEGSCDPIITPSKTWDEYNNNFVVEDPEHIIQVQILKIEKFLSKLGLKNFKLKTLEKIYKDILITKTDRHLSANKYSLDEDLLVFEDAMGILLLRESELSLCFTSKTSDAIIAEFRKVRQSSPSVSTLISASGILGRGIGEKRLDIILQKVPNFVEKCPSTKELESVPGISTILSEKIIVNHFKMMQLLSRMKLIFPNLSTAEDNNDDDSKFIVCLSGFRIKPPHTYNCVLLKLFLRVVNC